MAELSERHSVLIVDDDDTFRERLARALTERGYDVQTAIDVPQARLLIQQDPPEAALLDLRMPGEPGTALVEALLAADPHTRIIILTGYGSVATAVDAIKRGATQYLQKPVHVAEIERALRGEDPTLTNAATPSLARQEWEYIHRVLDDCSGNISEAARRLGIHRRSLQRKLQKHPPRR